MDPGARVCPFCGEPPGTGVFCAACGRNLADVQQLPTREAWEQASAASPEPPVSPATATAAVGVAGFVAAMHAAGDPGAARTPRSEPGFLGRTQHAHGWVVRAVERDAAAPRGRYEPGLFVTVEGRLHSLMSASRGAGTRDGARYVDLVGPELAEPVHDARLAADLAAALRANGVGA
jgi:hypothetical protein